MDTMTKEARSGLMARIRSTGTGPELRVEAAARRLRRAPATHDRSLPGRPDMAFPRSKCAVFVHGCFWHRHSCKAGRRECGTNKEFWEAKFEANKRRDRRAARELRGLGWRVLTVWEWECETRDADKLRRRLQKFLQGDEKKEDA